MTEPSAVVAAKKSVLYTSNNQKGCASFGWLHLLVGAIVLLRGADLVTGDEGTGALQITDFGEQSETLTTECNPGWIESLQVDHGDWVDGIRVYCSDDPTSIKFAIGKANDVSEMNVCEGSGGIASITGYSIHYLYLSQMTFTCLDGTEFGPYGSQYHNDSAIMTTSCDSSYQYATGFKYYQPCDIITKCTAVSCNDGCDFQYLQLMCSNVSNFSEPDNETESTGSTFVVDTALEITVTVIGTVIATFITGMCTYMCKTICQKAGKAQEPSQPVQYN